MMKISTLRFVRAVQRAAIHSHTTTGVITSNARLDITGNKVNIYGVSNQNEVMALFDEAIINTLTHSNDPVVQLREIRLMNKTLCLPNALLVFHLIRHPRPRLQHSKCEITECLTNLEDSLNSGKMSLRERAYAAAVAALASGRKMKSGALFEGSLLDAENQESRDVLALKLAQECYLMDGDSTNVLGCVARWLQLFESFK